MLQAEIDDLKSKIGHKVSCELTSEISDAANVVLDQFPDHPNLVNLRTKYCHGCGGGFAVTVDTTDICDLIDKIPVTEPVVITSQDVGELPSGMITDSQSDQPTPIPETAPVEPDPVVEESQTQPQP